MPNEQLRKFVRDASSGQLGLAEALRWLVEVRRKMDPADPERALLDRFVTLDEKFDLARAGYADMAELTEELRAALDELRRQLGV